MDEFYGLYIESASFKSGGEESRTVFNDGKTVVTRNDLDDGAVFSVQLESALAFDDDLKDDAARETAKCLKALIKPFRIKKNDLVLVAGVGNEGMTADALGSRCLKYLEITEHLYDSGVNLPGRGRLSGIAGSVRGVTGINSFDIIKGVTDRVKPKLVIAVDTLASRKATRLKRVIQLTDRGMIPGSGVQNARTPLNEETLGIPVIAVGVPLVIYARNILTEYMRETKLSDLVYGKDTVYSKAESELKELVVTVKDIDSAVEDFGRIIGRAINSVVHGMEI